MHHKSNSQQQVIEVVKVLQAHPPSKAIAHLRKTIPLSKKIPSNFSQSPRAIITNATPCSTHVIAP